MRHLLIAAKAPAKIRWRQLLIFAATFCSGFASAGTAPHPALYFPTENEAWETVSPAVLGWDETKLNAALDYAMQERSAGIVILYRGKIAAERHALLKTTDATGQLSRYGFVAKPPTPDGRSREDVASVQKSVISVLIGIAQQKGLINIEKPVSKYLGDNWSAASSAEEREITVEHLLAMSSGLNLALAMEHPPGEKWFYNTAAYGLLATILEQVTARPLQTLSESWLLGPLQMSASRWEARVWAKDRPEAVANGFVSTARDLSRFGLLMLAKGRWGKQQIFAFDEYFVSGIRNAKSDNPNYGYLWWLNRDANNPTGDKLIATAPNDLYAAQGALRRSVFVAPRAGLVVVRIGDQPGDKFSAKLWRKLAEAMHLDIEP